MPVIPHTRRGFSLIEMIVATAVFALFCVGIYSGIQFIFKVVYQSRLQIVEAAIANEHLEIVRNMAYDDVGIVNGSPAGLLQRTVTTTKNGLVFEITRTIRNIDDPYDGVIGGNPNDTAPTDYKLVDISVLCITCNQTHPVALSTHVGPKYLEGNPANGALFVHVIDASGDPVVGASVHIVATSTSPALDFVDTTNNSGLLSVVDLPAGIGKYHITVSKAGYTTSGTMAPTAQVPNPIHPPASVVAQDVSQVTFIIDQVSSMAVESISAQCSPIGNASFTVIGTNLLGKDPDVLVVSSTYVTNAGGAYALNNFSWDTYTFWSLGYDLLGTIPMVPYALQPGMDQPIQLILGANTARSLLVNVRDSITLQPISSAEVQLVGTGFNTTETTGVGHVRQTDWSGGSGQSVMSNASRYFSDNGGIDATTLAGNLTLQRTGQTYVSQGWLESSTFDLGTTGNYINLIWEPLAQPEATGPSSVKFQLATHSSSTPENWNYLGPDGTATSYYTDISTAIHEVHDGDQYMRYKIWLSSASTTSTPTISDIALSYTNSCTPPGQVYFGNLVNQLYTVNVSAAGYQPYAGQVTADSEVHMVVDMTK